MAQPLKSPTGSLAGREPAPVRRARAHGEEVAHSPQYEWLARGGLVARGVIYGIIGILAIKLALTDGGETTDQQGALQEIAQQPFGKALLILMAVGLAGYSVWRIVRAAIGHGPESGQDDGLERVGGLASGVVYALLCFTAVQILIGSGGEKGNEEKTTGGVLDWTGGTWIVGIGGLIMIGVAGYQAHQGITKKFLEKSKIEQMGAGMRELFTRLGLVGHLARAVIFAIIGYALIKAAIDHDADKAVGLDGALAKLAQASYGPVLLSIVAAGLAAFAAFSILDARYRKI